MDSLTAFKTYYSLKLHFKHGVNIFKYNPEKMKYPMDRYEKAKGIYEAASRIPKFGNFCLANLYYDPNIFIKDMIESSNAKEVYNEWEKRFSALRYHFNNDMKLIGDDFNSAFLSKDPLAYNLLKKSKICPETILIFDNLYCIMKTWEVTLKDDYYFCNIFFTICKFLKYFFLVGKSISCLKYIFFYKLFSILPS